MATSVMTNAIYPAASSSLSSSASSSAALSTPELLLLTEALVQLAQQTQQTQQVSLADVDWTAIATMLASRYPLGSSTALTPNLLSSQLLTHLSSLSAASSASSIPLAALVTLSTTLKQQRLQQLKDEYAASTVRQQQLEDQVKSVPTTSSSLPTARPDLPIPPSFPSPSSNTSGMYPSTPLLMSPLQRSVSEKSRLPSTPLPATAASIAHMPPLEESTTTEPEAVVSSQQQQVVKEEAAGPAAVKREAAVSVQVTPPPPLRRTITDMELDRRSPEPDMAAEEADSTTQQQTTTDTAEPMTTDSQQQQQQPDTTDTSPSTTTSSSPTNRTSTSSSSSPATLAATCLELLTCLQRHPDADPFRYPVDPSEVPNYYDMIRQPMDFDTIQRQLTQTPPLITTAQQFHERLLLVFQNAYTFNDKKTSFYKMARNLDAFAAELCRKYWPEDKKSFQASPEARKATGRLSKGGGVVGGGGVKEVELETPVGVMVVGVVSAPSSPNEKDGGGGGEDEVGAVWWRRARWADARLAGVVEAVRAASPARRQEQPVSGWAPGRRARRTTTPRRVLKPTTERRVGGRRLRSLSQPRDEVEAVGVERVRKATRRRRRRCKKRCEHRRHPRADVAEAEDEVTDLRWLFCGFVYAQMYCN